MAEWTRQLNADPLPWLLDETAPAVRHLALRRLLDRPADDPEVVAARKAAMSADPIAAFLAAMQPEGWWVKAGPGYGPKYASTVWSFMFLDQMGADGADPRIQRACDYVIEHTQTVSDGLGCSGGISRPAPSAVIHCLSGNLLRALIGFGRLDDERVRRALDYQAAAVTGEGDIRFYKSAIPGPGFRCAANEGLPCAWGAVKVLWALARVPASGRSPALQRAVDAGVEFLLAHDPAVADYPMGYGNTKPNASWFKLGFPSGYVTDVLQTMEALCEAGAAGDPRLDRAVEWLVAQQDRDGRWANRYAYARKTIAPIDAQGKPSRWVTLRACTVLKAVSEARATTSGRDSVAAASPAADSRR